MKGSNSNELGHRNYQHPQRKAQHFGPYLDNFSSWAIYTSLAALHADPRLFERVGAGEDCLLFRQEDFADPVNSCAFKALEEGNDEVRHLAHCLRAALRLPLDQVSPLDAAWQPSAELPPIAQDAPRTRHEAQKRKAALHIESLPQKQIQRQPQAANVQFVTQNRSRVNLASPPNVRLVAGTTPAPAAGSPATTASQSPQPQSAAHHQAPGIPFVVKIGFIEPELRQPAPRLVITSPRMPTQMLISIPSAFVPILIGAIVSMCSCVGGLGAPSFLLFLMLVASLFVSIPKTSSQTESDRHLVQYGQPAVATVTQKLLGQHRALCSFTDQKGEQHLVLVRVPDYEMPYIAIGDQLTVLYDPIAPTTKLCFYRFSAYQAAPSATTSPALRQPVKTQLPDDLNVSLADLRSAIADLKQSTANLSATRAATAKNKTSPKQNQNNSHTP